MDGETALRYARTRHQDSDFGRMARQQRVMVALRSRLIQPTNWWRAPGVLAAVQRATKTDVGPFDLATLAVAAGFGAGEPDRLALDLGLVEEFRGAGGAFLLRPTPALQRRVGVFLDPSSAAVEILNGTRTPGLAKGVSDRLRARGFQIVSVGDAATSHRQTVIEVAPGLKRAGALAGSILEVPRENVGEGAALPPGVDVRVTLGG
jgi:hypothetical protein